MCTYICSGVPASSFGKNTLDIENMDFFINVLKQIKSNAIAIFDSESLLSQTGGQTSRIDALKNCISKLKARHKNQLSKKLFLYSGSSKRNLYFKSWCIG